MKKAYWEFDRFDKRTYHVNAGIYNVDSVDENGITTAHWIVPAGSENAAINRTLSHEEVRCNEHLEASPIVFQETAYPMPFEF